MSDAHISGNERRTGSVHAVTHRNGELVQVKARGGSVGGGGGQRAKIAGFSRQSRRRLLYLLASIDQEASGLPRFVTLTYPGKDWESYATNMKRHLDNFHRWLTYHHPRASAIWRLEMQKRGAPHFHLLVFGVAFLDCLRVAETWWHIVGSGQESHLQAGTQVKGCSRWREATSYMAKYMAKPQEDAAEVHELWKLPGRFWGVWGDKNLPVYPEYWSLTYEAAVRFRRILRGHAKSRGYRLRGGLSVTSFLPQAAAERALRFCQAHKVPLSTQNTRPAESERRL
ncbi:MAG: hypothetical protein GXX83_08745 [Gaiellales bacterium]|nr:hypothetical protein [Gaiellales bacterium]